MVVIMIKITIHDGIYSAVPSRENANASGNETEADDGKPDDCVKHAIARHTTPAPIRCEIMH